MTKLASITCPVCEMTSYNPNDIEQGYCGNCSAYTSSPATFSENGEKNHGPISSFGNSDSADENALTVENMKRWQSEKLDPELQRYSSTDPRWGLMVQHPLVYDIMCLVPGMVNRRLALKKADLAKAIERQDYSQIVFLHERPWRLHALLEYVITEDDTVWDQKKAIRELIEHIWTDSENIHQHQDEWLQLYSERPPGGFLGDRKAFDALPDPVTLYRGGDPGNSFLSWTTDFAIATRFANRFIESEGEARQVRHREIAKADIFAYFTSRGESEALSFVGMGE